MGMRRENRLYVVFLVGIAVIFVLIDIVPVYWIGLSAITPVGKVFWSGWGRYLPLNLTLENFRKLFLALPYGRYFLNSVLVCTVSASISIFLALLASYAFARLHFRGKNLVFWLLLASMMLPGIAMVIPVFQLFKVLNLINTLIGLIILFSSNLLPFTIWVTTSFFDQVPRELEEAAFIDGATFWQTFVRVVLPLMRPIVASMLVINFIAAWNDLIWPLVLSLKPAAKLLTNGLVEAASIGGELVAPWETISAMSSIMIIPVILIVLFFQRQIMAGLLAGAFK